MTAVFAAVYLTAFIGSTRRLVFGVLFAAGAMALLVSTVMVAEYVPMWSQFQKSAPMPGDLVFFAWLSITALPLLLAWRLNRTSVLPVAVVLLMAAVLPHLHTMSQLERSPWQYPILNLSAYALVALVAAFLAWWGVQQRSRAIINYGVVCFALSVLWFYFSSIMGKLERSFSLILLGLLFLGGGWLLEKTRRTLVRHIQEAP